MKRAARLLLLASMLVLLLAPVLALAAPRSGGSFSGRGGFRSGGGSYSRGPARTPGGSYSRDYSRGPNVVVFPGWGFLPFMGGGGGGVGGLLMIGLLGIGALMLLRAVRRGRVAGGPAGGLGLFGGGRDDDEAAVDRAHVYRIQLGLGRSARGIQQRLEQFAAEGDTASEAGLAYLLSQTALELMREKDAIRYALVEAAGPMSLTNGETRLNTLALQERSRFQVERVRGADGSVRRSTASGARTDEVLEYLLVTVLVATRTPLPRVAEIGRDKALHDRDQLDAVLAELGGVPPAGLLGMEVIWTPADPEDAMTEAEMVLLYPELKAV
jgi:uncharacterized membrane protein